MAILGILGLLSPFLILGVAIALGAVVSSGTPAHDVRIGDARISRPEV